METLELEKRSKEKKSSLKNNRASGLVPGVCYGANQETVSIYVNQSLLKKVEKVAGKTPIQCKGAVEGNVIIQDMQFNPLTGNIIHIDFHLVKDDEKTHTTTPIILKGVAPAIKKLGGVLTHIIHEVNIEALPKDIPHEIEVDISMLEEIPSHITIADITIPKGVTILNEKDEVVVSVVSQESIVVEDSVDTKIDMDSVEATSEKKPEDNKEETQKDES